MAARVFINYRGTDEPWAAIAIDNELSRLFGDHSVFLASRSIPPGKPFDESLLDAVRACGVLLAVIGRRWLTTSDGSGRRLIDDRRDWVRREIVEAFAADTLVVPVLVGEVGRLDAAALPTGLRRLATCPFVRLRHRDFRRDLARIAAQVVELEPGLPAGPALA